VKLLSNQRLPLALLLCCLPTRILAQAPNVPQQYRRLFYYYADQRSLYEKALNSISLTSQPVGRSYAIIVGVTKYPNLSPIDRDLKPAAVDIEKLKSYLKDQEFFDEIIVLKDGDVNLDNLNYFLENYFPDRLSHSPHSRFLFAFSGHGYAEGTAETARGFLLTSSAASKTDPVNRIDLGLLRTLLDSDIDAAEKVLVLINACQSGAFLGRKSFGANPLGPGDHGAHAIMASRANQQSLQLAAVGPGSVFFEKIFAGLAGAADNSPRDGVVTYHELDSYLHSEIPYVTNGSQIPMEGDISRNGSIGEFFFLNRGRQVQLGNVKPWTPGGATAFGEPADNVLELGKSEYRAEHYKDASRAFKEAAVAGNADAMNNLGYLYEEGQGVAQDYQQAQQWYEKAAAAGSATAMNNLGNQYGHGHGVAQDYKQARQWYEKAAAAGNADAMNSLGYLYDQGLGVAQDYQQARLWFEKGAAAGGASAMNSLGYLYDYGQGVAQDYRQARQWYEKSAAGGDLFAMYNLGDLYDQGRGVAQDYRQSRQWYEKAAAGGNPFAMYVLGSLYDQGRGVAQDYQQARKWYEEAAAAGNNEAKNRLSQMPK
jgi:TPR repeat protein